MSERQESISQDANGATENMASASDVPPLPTTWEQDARAMQQEFYEQLGGDDWRSYKASELEYLLRNIGFALFGQPNEEANDQNLQTGYGKDHLEVILNICETIRNKDDHGFSKTRNLYQSIGREVYGDQDEEPSVSNEQSGYSQRKLSHIKKILECMKCKKLDRNLLHQNITEALYGSWITYSTVSPEKREIIQEIGESIQILIALEANVTWLSVVFVILKVEFEGKFCTVPEPVFRVPLETSEGVESHIFIDRNRRVYEGWDRYLKNNKLPNCTYCYPTAGVYEGDKLGNVLVEFGQTPAGSTANAVVDVVDKAGVVAGVGSTAVMIAAMTTIPVAAPLIIGAAVAGGAVGLWGIIRGSENLIDRGMHEQSINVTDAEARNAWITIGASSLGLAAAGATTAISTLTRSGVVVGETVQLLANVTQVTALTANGVSIINGAFNLHEKYKSDTLTGLDVFQFSSSVLFFTNSVANFRMAKTIIQETQTSVLEDYRSNLRSNRHRKAFDRVAKNTRDGDAGVHGNAKVIRGINSINNPDDFFSGVVRLGKHHKQAAAKLTLTDTGNVDINGRMTVNPSKFADIPKADRTRLLTASKKFNDGELSKTSFDAILKDIYKPTNVPDEVISRRNSSILYKIFKTNVCDDFNFNILERGRLIALAQKHLAPIIMPLAMELFRKLFGNHNEEFVEFMEYSYNYILTMVSDLEQAYQAALLVASEWTDFKQTTFDLENGIIGDRFNHFVQCVRKILIVADRLGELRASYTVYRQTRHRTSEANSHSNDSNSTANNSDANGANSPLHNQNISQSFQDLNISAESPDPSLNLTDPPINNEPSQIAAESVQTPPRPPVLGRLRAPTSVTYQWDFSVDGELSDDDIFTIAADLSRLYVDHTVVYIHKLLNRFVVIFNRHDITVTVITDVVNGCVKASITNGNCAAE